MSGIHLEQLVRQEEQEIGLGHNILDCFETVISPLDVVNSFGRVYRSRIVRHLIAEQTENMRYRRLIGEMGPKDDLRIRLQNASHLITNMYIVDNIWYAQIEILNTYFGRMLHESVGRRFFTPFGIGNIFEDESGRSVVRDEYQFITITAWITEIELTSETI